MPIRHVVTIARRTGPRARLAGQARATVVVAIGFGAVYLGWRIGWTRSGTQPVLFWRLWIAELVIWLSLLRFAHDAWALHSTPRSPAGETPVDIVVVCREEPAEVVRATLLGCRAIRHPHRTVVVDTVGRADIRRWAEPLGVEVFRTKSVGPNDPLEAGLAAVLEHLDAELVTVLAADHVPLPEMLDELVGDFEDTEVWMAQGRQAVYGSSPGEVRGSASEQDLFYRIIQPGKNTYSASYWCGSGGVVRRRALDALGGIPPRSDTPGFRLSIAAAAQGWRSTFHAEPVVLTLARPDLDGFIAQHAITAQGNLQALRTRQNPLFAKGLTRDQRLSYLGTLVTYLSGLRRFAMVWILCATLVSGALPVRADPVWLLGMWGIWMGLASLASQALGRGTTGTLTGARHRWLLLGAYCTAWLSLLVPRRVVLAVRNPPRSSHLGEPTPRLRLLVAGATVIAVSTLWRLGATAGIISLPEMSATATWATVAIAAVLLLGIAELLYDTHRRTRRRTPRFVVEATARLGGEPHRVLDLAEGGASVLFGRPPRVGSPFVVTLRLPGLDGSLHQATVAAEVRSVRRIAGPPGSGFAVGLAFTHLSSAARDRLTEYCRVLLPARDAVDSAAIPRRNADLGPTRARARGPAA